MPQYYYLYTMGIGGGWVYSGYVIRVTGQNNPGTQVMAAPCVYGQSPPSGPWSTVSGVTRGGSGNPQSPANGDTLSLPTTVGGVNNILGTGTFATSGDKGAGYYTGQGDEGAEGDWCAGAN